MRRRLLIANSHAESGGGDLPSDGLPPESTSFGFPLYLNITTLGYEDDSIAEYMREQDNINDAFFDWLYENRVSTDMTGRVNIGDNEIYINGCRVTEIKYSSFSDFHLYFDNPPFDDVGISTDRVLYGYIYK